MRFIVTGGLGYIGAHTVIQLCDRGHQVTILDDCSNSNIDTLYRLRRLTNAELEFYNVDLANRKELINVYTDLTKYKYDFVIHFAAYKNVGESNEKPLEYYQNNLSSLLNILWLCQSLNCMNLIFSSSCTVYPPNSSRPLTEEVPAQASNMRYKTIVSGECPYATSKIMCEQILHDICAPDSPLWRVIILRYFNPVGNHDSGLIGDSLITMKPNMNLFTAILNNRQADRTTYVFGDDYPTRDGTVIRDYIHVMDVADAHVKAAEWLERESRNKIVGLEVFNIGTGQGRTVMEVIQQFIKNGFHIKYEVTGRRDGDVAEVYADCTKANNILEWHPKYSFDKMVKDSIYYYWSMLS